MSHFPDCFGHLLSSLHHFFHHIQLTRSSGSWIPRLERMIQSRKLCDLEKNVLITLIGSVIQPNKFSTYDSGINIHSTQVGDLLRSFCSGLEEQIQSRRYFYKSGSLVREGMVLVNSSGLTGDPSSATVCTSESDVQNCI